MNKRGASHIEIIFSFILFVAVIGSALYFLNPTGKDSRGELISQHALNGIEKYGEVNLISYSVVITNNGLKEVSVNIGEVNSSYSASAEDSLGNRIPVIRSGSVVGVSSKERFFIIRLSEGIKANYSSIGLKDNDEDKYTISSISPEKVVSERKITDLKNIYDLDYNGLKNSLGVPSNMDFSFYIDDNGNRTEAGADRKRGTEVYVLENNIKVIGEDGKVKFDSLGVSVW